jgi:hypothetical protein
MTQLLRRKRATRAAGTHRSSVLIWSMSAMSPIATKVLQRSDLSNCQNSSAKTNTTIVVVSWTDPSVAAGNSIASSESSR